MSQPSNIRQRFFVDNQPVRGDMVTLQESYQQILSQRAYPPVIAKFLGELLAAASLLASTLKFEGQLSLQARGEGALKWAMAECTSEGHIRALASWDEVAEFADDTPTLTLLTDGVLFINIDPKLGKRYQGIIAIEKPTLAACLADYFDYSAQTPTVITLAADGQTAAGLLLQLLPRSTEAEQETVDTDIWPRMVALTETLSRDELLSLDIEEVLYRLYHEENLVMSEPVPLKFACTCSREKCETTLIQLGEVEVNEMLADTGDITINCDFCGQGYHFSTQQALALVGQHVS